MPRQIQQPPPEDVVYDDDSLLADRVLRTLHRNKDGHLAPSQRHKELIEEGHNVAVLYLYLCDGDTYLLSEHYVYSPDPLSYKRWVQVANREADSICDQAGAELYGIFGWITARIQVTPLRTGDLFIRIDKSGATGVRLAFSSREDKPDAQTKAKPKARAVRRNRFR